MGRTISPKSINGWLAIDKQKGVSSASVVRKLKWLLKAKKAGHAGTLDPDATGILAIALGEATKTIPYVMDALKSYQFDVVFGHTTDTDDATGKIIKSSNLRPKNNEIKTIIKSFNGHIEQVPPNFSAVKVKGERAYHIAKNNDINFTLSARPLWIKNLTLVTRVNKDLATMEMTCGKGGYVRAIARDIGKRLGCYGHATNIRRTMSGPFTLSETIPSEKIFLELGHEIEKNILPIHTVLGHLISFECGRADADKLQKGQNINLPILMKKQNENALALLDSKPIAIGTHDKNKFYPKKVFVY